MPALALAAENTPGQATQTTLTAETRAQNGRTQATVAVTGADGRPATGAVVINDHGKSLAGAALNAKGQATIELDLAEGDHALRAAYAGDATHQASTSSLSKVQTQTSSTAAPDFGVSVSPASLTLTPGQSGTIKVTVTPKNNSTLTAPMFVGLSCSTPSDEFSCTATPASVEILSTTTTAPTSTIVVQTQAATSTSSLPAKRQTSPIAWAFLLPGVLGLGGLAWGSRRRRWLQRLSLMALLGMVTMLGATACNPRYNYLNHSPLPGQATPAGTYTVSVTGEYGNSVTSIERYSTFVLTVK
jgi:hypothetical protein